MVLDLLTQATGHRKDIVKLISPPVFDKTDSDRFIEASDRVWGTVHKSPRPMWKVGFPPGEGGPAIGEAGVPKDRQ